MNKLHAVLLMVVILAQHAQGQSSSSAADQMHLDALEFPTAESCAKCHPSQYEQWSISPHSYGAISPVYNAMNAFMNKETRETCVSCHNYHFMGTIH